MVTLLDIKSAQQTIKGVAARTFLIRCGTDDSFFLKPESLQPIGSFKLRGAYNKIASRTEAERKRGVIAHSSGNHAQGVAYAARALGVKATIVVPSNIPPVKLEATKSYGPEVLLVGNASAGRLGTVGAFFLAFLGSFFAVAAGILGVIVGLAAERLRSEK